MTATYDQHGVQFMYPTNWTVTEEHVDESLLEINAQSPSGGFWALRICDEEVEPSDLVAEALRGMKTEYPDLESAERSEDWGEITARGYELDFYLLDLIVTARILAFSFRGRSYVVLTQAENREYEEMEAVFQAMSLSLVQSFLAQSK